MPRADFEITHVSRGRRVTRVPVAEQDPDVGLELGDSPLQVAGA